MSTKPLATETLSFSENLFLSSGSKVLRYLESVPLILVAGVPQPSALSAMFFVFATQDSTHAPFNQNRDSPIPSSQVPWQRCCLISHFA